MNKRFVVGNWKMNLGIPASKQLASDIVQGCRDAKCSVWLAPSYQAISEVATISKGSKILVGSQNIHWDDAGAFTGELSPSMLKEIGGQFAIVGHSERRHVFGESIGLCVKRGIGALKSGLKVIFCVGEKADERKTQKTEAIIQEQLEPLLGQVTPDLSPLLLIAYEPVWAIGTGVVAKNDEIVAAHNFIGSLCGDLIKGENPPILYGGSVTPDNFDSIIDLKGVAGGLIGGASLLSEKFLKLVKIAG